MRTYILFASLLIISLSLSAQQNADPEFDPPIEQPAYAPGQGSVIKIDEGHFNFHTLDGRYKPFADFLRKDGYQLAAYQGEMLLDSLRGTDILVVSNALNEHNVGNWTRPVLSAFTENEIQTLQQWVSEGGSLFLIADHMPLAGASADLAAAFGFAFRDGFNFQIAEQNSTLVCRRADSTLHDSPVTRGRKTAEQIDSVTTFTGQAFPLPEDAIPVLEFGPGWEVFMPDTAWRFRPHTPSEVIEGWSQGALLEYGKGRVAVFGEAAMFSAQVAGASKQKMGMNAPQAAQNPQFLLNIIHWLDGML